MSNTTSKTNKDVSSVMEELKTLREQLTELKKIATTVSENTSMPLVIHPADKMPQLVSAEENKVPVTRSYENIALLGLGLGFLAGVVYTLRMIR